MPYAALSGGDEAGSVIAEVVEIRPAADGHDFLALAIAEDHVIEFAFAVVTPRSVVADVRFVQELGGIGDDMSDARRRRGAARVFEFAGRQTGTPACYGDRPLPERQLSRFGDDGAVDAPGQ